MNYLRTLCIITTQLLAPAYVMAQMSAEDVERLRQRGVQEGWTFDVGENWATRNAHERLCGFVQSEDWESNARFVTPPMPANGLPAAFDWRDWSGVTVIRNQGGCGSCWAFSTVATLESNIAIMDGDHRDLSEQWLLSCNDEGWNCDGGAYAHEYHIDATDPCDDSGAVPEVAFPYVAAQVACGCPYTHTYWIDDWAYVVPLTTDFIKAAILDFGPVAVSLHADYDAFKAYNGGIFNACESGFTDHAVVLVGWNDNEGGGVWIMRNSWGTDWGASGYMRIPYDCSEVGSNANFIIYPHSGRGQWVDFAYGGAEENGRFWTPFNTLAEGVFYVVPGGNIRIRAGSSPETLAITKAVTLTAVGGTVAIGG